MKDNPKWMLSVWLLSLISCWVHIAFRSCLCGSYWCQTLSQAGSQYLLLNWNIMNIKNHFQNHVYVHSGPTAKQQSSSDASTSSAVEKTSSSTASASIHHNEDYSSSRRLSGTILMKVENDSHSSNLSPLDSSLSLLVTDGELTPTNGCGGEISEDSNCLFWYISLIIPTIMLHRYLEYCLIFLSSESHSNVPQILCSASSVSDSFDVKDESQSPVQAKITKSPYRSSRSLRSESMSSTKETPMTKYVIT